MNAGETRRGALDRFLDGIERVGNAVPHPAVIFLWLIAIVIVLSALLALVGAGVTYERADPVTGEIETVTTEVESLLAPDGLRFMLTSPVANFMGFGAVGVILVAMVGVGLAERSGLVATLVKQIVKVAPRSLFTFIVVMLGVVSSIAADAGYLVLVPLGAAAFHSLGRHPLDGVAVEGTAEPTAEERRGLVFAGRALLVFVVVVGVLSVPPGAIFRHQETREILSGSPFMSGLIVLISPLFFVLGFAYGKGAGTVKTLTAAIESIIATFAGLAGLIFLLLVIAQFIAFFNFTNMATVLAATLADGLEQLPIGAVGYIVIFVVTVAIVDLVITGAVAEWAILAPIFIPLFMRLGGDPDLVLAAYRVGDSPVNVVTPLNVYLGVMVGFAQKYVKDAGIGTIVALMLPYTIVLLIAWALLLLAWYLLGLPLLPG